MIDYKENFKQELARLNAKQREAVEHIEGPALVIAGPGTGKTQIIAARIGYILENTQVGPHNILALTYTEAGSVNMRTRLTEFIGPDAHRVTIGTYHEFCNIVIQENQELFGVRDLEPISPIEEQELLRKLIDQFGAKHRLKRFTGDVYWEAPRLKDLFSTMKKEHWTAEFIEQHVSDYARKAHLKPDAEKKLELIVAAAHEFPNYQAMMRDRGRYDFDDMILWTLEKFEEMPELLLNYQERFQYFHVDEYQDTSGTQNDLLFALANFWDVPNVFAVGDDDQSIYRFQGANVANIIQFHERYKQHVKVIVLEENYRSSERLLNLADGIINRNEERLVTRLAELGLTKKLQAASAFADSQVAPEVRAYYNEAHETVGIAREILRLREKNVNLNEVAVLYKQHAQVQDLQRYLEALGIPVNVRKRSNILESPFIQNLLSLLQYVSDESQLPHSGEDLLFHILHMPFFEIRPKAIAEVALDIRKKHTTKSNGQRPSTYWRTEISEAGNRLSDSLFDTELNESFERMKRLSLDIEYWITNLHGVALLQLIEKVVTRGGVLQWLMAQPDREWLMQELTTLYEFVKAESARHGQLSLHQLLKTIDLMKEEYLPIEINKMLFSEDGVNLITVHSAKGLEFQYVFLIGCTKPGWDYKSGSRGRFSYPPNLIPQTHYNVDEDEERRRLFYVAITRAKESLVVSYAARRPDDKPIDNSRFVSEMEKVLSTRATPVHLTDEEMVRYSQLMLTNRERTPHLPDDFIFDESFLKPLLQNFSLSVSSLNFYLKCPISFYFEKLLRIPSAKNQYMAFGSAVHDALYVFFKMMKQNNDVFPKTDQLLHLFEKEMNRQRPSFTEEQFKNRLAFGREILPRYVEKYKSNWNKIITVERKVAHSQVRGIPINGRMDKIEFDGKNANVVDYKTGRIKNAKNKFSPPGYQPPRGMVKEHEYKNGGDYWRQAVFYKLLIDNDPSRDWNVVSTEFDFIEPEEFTKDFLKVKVDITKQDLDTVTGQIEKGYSGIMNLEFTRGCNDKWCTWCNFIKGHFTEEPEDAELVELD